MTCFMKKMRYMEKNMRNGPAWIGNEVNILKENVNTAKLMWYCGLKSVVLNNLLNMNRLRCKDDRPSVLLLSTFCLELLVSRCDG